MSRWSDIRYRLANAMLSHAACVMPEQKSEWVRAMRAELDYMDQRQLLRWALGCVTVSYLTRYTRMDRSSLLISKWLLAIEASVCLFPAALLWCISMLMIRVLAAEPAILVGVVLMTAAPLNLWIAIRFVAGRQELNRMIHSASALLFAVCSIPWLLGLRFTGHGPSFVWFQFDAGVVLLLYIIPGLCCWHLAIIATERSRVRMVSA